MTDEKETSSENTNESGENHSGNMTPAQAAGPAAVPAKANAVTAKEKTAKQKQRKRASAKNKSAAADTRSLAKRSVAPFPAVSFEEALTIANAIQKHGGGQRRVRRTTLFDALDKSPDSGPSRQMVTNSGRYELTTGSYKAEFLELTADGEIASNNELSARERTSARFKLAIQQVAPFNSIYERLKGNRLPTTPVLEDLAKEFGVAEAFSRECVETFIVNARFIGILRTMSGAERIVSIEHLLDELPSSLNSSISSSPIAHAAVATGGDGNATTSRNWETTCFYISPIGDEETEHRQHADLFLGSIVEPALEEFGLTVIRADQIGKPGMITAQVIEHILKSKLVVADLSFHNPNVFYELCLRHVSRLPTVQIIRQMDKIPFDLDQFRTVQVDTTNIYSLVPNLQSYKAQIATQVRAVLANADAVDNPITTYCPGLNVSFQ